MNWWKTSGVLLCAVTLGGASGRDDRGANAIELGVRDRANANASIATSGRFVGLTGPWFPDGWIEPEITWALIPGHHGKGYATEAARAALEAAYSLFGWTTAVSVIATENAASIAVAERLGATREASMSYRYGPAYLYRHRPPETPPSQQPHQPHEGSA